MTWTDAPAGFAGSGSVALPPFACVTAVVDGRGQPVAARLRPIDERGVANESLLRAVTGIASVSATTENNGTTLGIHFLGRPQS